MFFDHRLGGLTWLRKTTGRLNVLLASASIFQACSRHFTTLVGNRAIQASSRCVRTMIFGVLNVSSWRYCALLVIDELIRQLPIISRSRTLRGPSTVTDCHQHWGLRRAAVYARLMRYG